MKITRMLLIVGMLLLSTTGFCSNQANNSKQIDNTIKVVVPQRPA